MSVCLSFRSRNSKTARPNFIKFRCILPITVARCDMLCTSGFADAVTFSHSDCTLHVCMSFVCIEHDTHCTGKIPTEFSATTKAGKYSVVTSRDTRWRTGKRTGPELAVYPYKYSSCVARRGRSLLCYKYDSCDLFKDRSDISDSWSCRTSTDIISVTLRALGTEVVPLLMQRCPVVDRIHYIKSILLTCVPLLD